MFIVFSTVFFFCYEEVDFLTFWRGNTRGLRKTVVVFFLSFLDTYKRIKTIIY